MTPARPSRPFLWLSALLLFLAPAAQAQTEPRAIYEEVERRQELVQDEAAEIEMTIVDPRGRTRTRAMTVYTKTDDGRTKSLVVFSAPADVRGTGLLTVETDEGDEQKLYLPALRRVQRIAGAQRGERFVGSDFSYEDLGTRDPDDFTFALVDETDTAWTLEAEPTNDDSPYSRIVFTIGKDTYTLRSADYYDDDGDLWKRLTADDFEEVAEGSWRASRLTMEDLQEERRTELVFVERQTGEALRDDLFTERQLQRGLR